MQNWCQSRIKFMKYLLCATRFQILTIIGPNMPSRLERWSIFCGDGMLMVIFSQRWNGDGFWKFLTITIDGFWWDQLSATMVFRWFSHFWEPMVNNGHWRKNAYFATNSNSQQIAGKFKKYKKPNTAWLKNTFLPIHTEHTYVISSLQS